MFAVCLLNQPTSEKLKTFDFVDILDLMDNLDLTDILDLMDHLSDLVDNFMDLLAFQT